MSEVNCDSLTDSGCFDSTEGSPRAVTPQDQEQGLDRVRGELGIASSSGNAAVRRAAARFADVLFDYALLHRSQAKGQTNVFGRPVVQKEHLTVAGSGESLRGCLAMGKHVGALVSSDSFLDLVPLLREGQGALVIHASSERYTDRGVVSDYSAIQTGLDTGTVCLVSYSAQEGYDMAVAAHLLAMATQRPVLHVLDGIAVGNRLRPEVKCHDVEALVARAQGLDLEGVFSLMAAAGFAKYAPVEVRGSGNHVSALPGEGDIQIRRLRPFPGEALVKALREEEVTVVEPIPLGRGLVYGEMLKWSHLLDHRVKRQAPAKQDVFVTVWGKGLVGRTLAAILGVPCDAQVDSTLPEPVVREQLPFAAEVVALQDFSLLKYLQVLGAGQTLLVNAPEKEDLGGLLRGRVLRIDAASVAREWGSENEAGLVFLVALSFCHGELSSRVKDALSRTSLSEAALTSLFALVEAGLSELPPQQEEGRSLVRFRGHGLDLPKPAAQPIPTADTLVKWQRLFPEAYPTEASPRPDLHDCHVIHVTKNVRLTPTTYDRNVFHLEFNTHHLPYNIGDALGVFGINHPDKVASLLQTLAIPPEATLQLPDHAHARHFVVTARQLFSQFLDLFGRPNKDFYRFLARHARDQAQAARLAFLASPEGSGEFQQRADDTTTYADLLREFDSARPPLAQLADAVPRIQPRHYSIASAMSLHPSSVHLLVVHVNWTNSRGYQAGQCTDYLTRLVPGDSVLVHVKPSLMTLPENAAPIVMAGLGTGMAPFRAFVQERYAQAKQGIPVGPSTLYFGSRHRASEYLYGEELDAYFATGTLTSLRLAFSRDQERKVYIQTLMQQDLDQLQHHLLDLKGSFYLCGPTWPEKDVRSALIQALSANHRMSVPDAQKYLHQMKEEGRYILELY